MSLSSPLIPPASSRHAKTRTMEPLRGTAVFLFIAILLSPSSALEARKVLNIPEKIIGGVIDIVQSHKNKPSQQSTFQHSVQTQQTFSQQGYPNQNQYQPWNGNYNAGIQGQAQVQGQYAGNQGSYAPTNTYPASYPPQGFSQTPSQGQYPNYQAVNGGQYQNQNQNHQGSFEIQGQGQIQGQSGQYAAVAAQGSANFQGSAQYGVQNGNSGNFQGTQTGQYQGVNQNGNFNQNQQSGSFNNNQQTGQYTQPIPNQSVPTGSYQGTQSAQNGNYQASQAALSGNYQSGQAVQTGNYQGTQVAQTGNYQTSQAGQTGNFQTSQAQTGNYQTSQAGQTGNFQTSQAGQTGNYQNNQSGQYGNYPAGQAGATGQYQSSQTNNQGTTAQGGSFSGSQSSGYQVSSGQNGTNGPTCVCQAWTKPEPLSDLPVKPEEQKVDPKPVF